ncbi:MAG: hypothetical protein RR571_08905 [Anaerorhabdus sp.]
MEPLKLKLWVDVGGQLTELCGIAIAPEPLISARESIPKELTTYSNEEVQKILNTYGWKVDKLRKFGVLKGIQLGKKYVYPFKEIENFLIDYIGMDLSNDNSIKESIHKVELKKIEEQLMKETKQKEKSH